MPRKTTIVAPYELYKFAEQKYGMNSMQADNLVRYVRAEYEVKTRDYYLAGVSDLDDDEACTDYLPARQLLIDFMTDNNLVHITVTQ